MHFDTNGFLLPEGNPDWLRYSSEHFTRTCPFSPVAKNESELAAELFPDAEHSDTSIGRFQTAYVGYVAEDDFRMQGSSGGMVSWVAAELLRKGLVDGVAHVIAAVDPQAEGRFFHYRISRTE
ncbi:MAG: coenzyme F420 hydrogenase, partial [Flavisolibacter sp.]|nr:coenzyme F420 hydrogenase [Flavisolibacter sp.]